MSPCKSQAQHIFLKMKCQGTEWPVDLHWALGGWSGSSDSEPNVSSEASGQDEISLLELSSQRPYCLADAPSMVSAAQAKTLRS